MRGDLVIAAIQYVKFKAEYLDVSFEMNKS